MDIDRDERHCPLCAPGLGKVVGAAILIGGLFSAAWAAGDAIGDALAQ